jgi:hypothetical protein
MLTLRGSLNRPNEGRRQTATEILVSLDTQ